MRQPGPDFFSKVRTMRPVVWALCPFSSENLKVVPPGFGMRTSLRLIQTGESSKSICQSLDS